MWGARAQDNMKRYMRAAFNDNEPHVYAVARPQRNPRFALCGYPWVPFCMGKWGY